MGKKRKVPQGKLMQKPKTTNILGVPIEEEKSSNCWDGYEEPQFFSCAKFGHTSKDCNKQRHPNRTIRQNDEDKRAFAVHKTRKRTMRSYSLDAKRFTS